MPSKQTALKNATILASYLLLVWGFYRLFFQLPETIEDLVVKPVIWLVPVFYFLRKEKSPLSSVGITFKNLFPSIYLALIMGVVFVFIGILTNFAKYQSLNLTSNIGQNAFFTSILLSLATGLSEEIAFRGFIFNRVMFALGDEWKANYLVSIVWTLIHLPIAIFWWKMNVASTFGMLLLIAVFGIGSSYVFARTKNVAASVLLHMLWEWPIILFR